MCESTSLPSPETYKSAGGFVWWYLDLRDNNGNGLVLIWAFGLPFLPNYADLARLGKAQTPIERPSLNISIYSNGKLDFYLLQEYSPDECDPTPHKWRFGETRIDFDTDGDSATLLINLSCQVPNASDRLEGRIHFAGPLRQGSSGTPDPAHQWTPIIVAAEGSADLNFGETTYTIKGRGYHDRNAGTAPLHDLDIDKWWWGRLAFPNFDLVFYVLISKSDPAPLFLALKVDRTGKTVLMDEVKIDLTDFQRSLYGLKWPRKIHLRLPELSSIEVRNKYKIEDGPFYQRFMCDAIDINSSVEGYGFVEQIVPDKVDTNWLRPLVKMRVHKTAGPNSMWLPLFTGPKESRFSRLLQGPTK